MSDATVFVFGMQDGLGRAIYITEKATTYAQGRYEITGPSGLYNFSAVLLAIAPGRSPVWSWPPFPKMMGKLIPVGTDPKPGELPEPITEDVVLPSQGGKLDVTVLKNGAPAAGMFVSARMENINLPVRPSDEATRKIVDDIAQPLVKTDEAGIAHFENLLPGRYQVSAGLGNVREMPGYWSPESATPFGLAESVPVRRAVTTRFSMAVEPLPYTAHFRMLHPDGKPFGDSNGSGYPDAESVRPTMEMNFNRRSPLGRHWYDCPGLWRVESKYPGPRDSHTNLSEPYFANLGVIAVSHCYQTDFVPEFTARWIEPASAHVTVLDSAGQPLHAVVEIGWGQHDPNFSGSTDENGSILFPGLWVQKDRLVCATIPDHERLDLLSDDFLRRPQDAPIPPDAKLQHRFEIFPQPLDLARNIETKITMSQESVGYIKGKLLPVADDDLKNFTFITDPALNQPYSYSYIRESTHEFFAGPFKPGPVRLILIRTNEKGGELRTVVATEVRGGDVTHLDLTPPPSPTESERTLRIAEYPFGRNAFFSDAIAAARNVFNGQVFLSNGSTPAWCAQVLYFQPGDNEPKQARTTDALGQFRPRATWWMNIPAKPGALQGPSEPVVVAFLPGTCGAAILPPPERSDQPMRIVLPLPIAQRGQVKVGARQRNLTARFT